MSHCPKDSTVCVDDLCRGSGVCLLTDEPMLTRCWRCGQLTDEFTGCACPPEADFDDDDAEPTP